VCKREREWSTDSTTGWCGSREVCWRAKEQNNKNTKWKTDLDL